MPRIIRSAEAKADVDEIARYIARDDLEAALRWLDLIDRKLKLLAEFPGAGVARDELVPHVRSFPVGAYLIFYVPAAGGIRVARVVHGSRNLRKVFSRRRPK